MSSTAERPVLLGSSIRLHQKNFFDDPFDVRLFSNEVPLRVATRHTEASRNEQHGRAPSSHLIPVWK
jgi:hypothetical protein